MIAKVNAVLAAQLKAHRKTRAEVLEGRDLEAKEAGKLLRRAARAEASLARKKAEALARRFVVVDPTKTVRVDGRVEYSDFYVEMGRSAPRTGPRAEAKQMTQQGAEKVLSLLKSYGARHFELRPA